MLVRHYVEELPHAEIADALGVTEDAVSMRISRGRAVLRRLLEAEESAGPAEGWQETRVWCSGCGRRRVEMRRDEAVAFRCLGCGDDPATVYDLSNPTFAELVGGLLRPAPMLKRGAAWSAAYFAGGAGEAGCTRCGGSIRLRRHERNGVPGLAGRCDACGQDVWSSADGLAQSLPAVRALRRDHPRLHSLPPRDERYAATDATIVPFRDVAGSAALDVVLERRTLRVLAVH